MDPLDEVVLLQVAVINQQLIDLDEEEEDVRRRRDIVRRRGRRPRRFQTRPWLTEERRRLYGHYTRLMEELRLEDPQAFFNYLRMEPGMFDELVQRVGPRIEKKDTRMRKALSPGLKLAITIRFLATGDKYPTLMYSFRVARNTVSLIIPEVCQAIVEEYKDEVISCPTTPAEWAEIGEVFKNKWNIPNAVGAIDGKHVAIRKPAKSGSLYHNYKSFFSVILMALVDGDYKFLWIDVSSHGSMSDAQIFNDSELKECLEDGSIGFPAPAPIPHDDEPMPYFILGDEAFGLRTFLMKPYGRRALTRRERIYNYRISRGRRVVENAFGILAQRWQVLLTTIQPGPSIVQDVVECCVCLHNLMRMRYPALHHGMVDEEDDQHNVVPGAWRGLVQLGDMLRVAGGNRDTRAAKRQQEVLKEYFNHPVGAVPWQDRMIDGQ